MVSCIILFYTIKNISVRKGLEAPPDSQKGPRHTKVRNSQHECACVTHELSEWMDGWMVACIFPHSHGPLCDLSFFAKVFGNLSDAEKEAFVTK